MPRLKSPADFPTWTRTVGAARDDAIGIRAICTGCGECREVDLAKLAAIKGDDYSLIDRRCRCKLTPGCKGWVKFHYLLGVYRPLWTDVATSRWMEQDREDWLEGLRAQRVAASLDDGVEGR